MRGRPTTRYAPRRWTLRLALALIAALWVGAAIGCDRAEVVLVTNRSAQRVVLYSDGMEIDQLPPGDSEAYGFATSFVGTKTFEVRRQDGELLVSHAFTWAELQAGPEIELLAE